MTVMHWDQSLDVGVEEMNKEHQGLLALMNRLHDLSQGGHTGQVVLRVLDELENATIEHFADEEAFFDSIGFPDAESHKSQHKRLLAKLSETAAQIRADDGKIGMEFFQFLKYWLSAHIQGNDMKYGDHAKKVGAADAA